MESSNDKNSDDSGNEDNNNALGGMLRSILRRIGVITKIEAIGRLPRRIPKKIPRKLISNTANTLSNAHDIYSNISNAYRNVKSKISKNIKSSKANIALLFYNKFLSVYKTITLASYDLVKAGVLGGILFDIYDNITSNINAIQGLSDHNSNSNTSEKKTLFNKDSDFYFNKFVVLTSLYCASAGAVSGAMHGMLYCYWDKGYQYIKNTIQILIMKLKNNNNNMKLIKITPTHNVLGTVLSHSIVHFSLFGSYELMKRLSLYSYGLSHKGEDITKLQGLYSIIIGGMIAGITAEYVGNTTIVLEENGIIQTNNIIRQYINTKITNNNCTNMNNIIKNIKNNGIMMNKSYKRVFTIKYMRYRSVMLLKISIPTMLGFLASEYATS